MRKSATAAPAGVRSKARRGYDGDGRIAQGVPGLLRRVPAVSLFLFFYSTVVHLRKWAGQTLKSCRNDASILIVSPQKPTRALCSERLWNLPMLLLLSSFVGHLVVCSAPNPMQTAVSRRWKRPKRTARSSQWSSASERYALCFLAMPDVGCFTSE